MRAGRCEGACGRTISGTFRRLLHSARWRTLGGLAGTGGHWTGTVGRQAVVQARPDQARACRAEQGRAGQTEQGGSQAGTGHWAGSRGGGEGGEAREREREGWRLGGGEGRGSGDAAMRRLQLPHRGHGRVQGPRGGGGTRGGRRRVCGPLCRQSRRDLSLGSFPVPSWRASEGSSQPASPVSARRRGAKGPVGSGQWAADTVGSGLLFGPPTSMFFLFPLFFCRCRRLPSQGSHYT